MTTATKAKPITVEQLIELAADEATVLIADGPRVLLRRLDGAKVSKALIATVEDAGAPLVAQELRDLGFAYIRVIERLATEQVGPDAAFRVAAVAWIYSRIPSDRIFVLPADPEPYSAETDEETASA